MSVRGIRQLKHLRLQLCDLGGSSAGVREALQSQQLVDYIKDNEHLNFEVTVRRNHHPFVSATYINGYTKDVPLRKTKLNEVMDYLESLNNQSKHKATNLQLEVHQFSIQVEKLVRQSNLFKAAGLHLLSIRDHLTSQSTGSTPNGLNLSLQSIRRKQSELA